MEEEILACIDDKDVKYLHSGQISKYIFPMERKEAHKNNISHLIVRFFIMAITPDNEILYLVQKRGKNKRGYPEHFTDSASGHVTYKKNLELKDIKENALRELEEEFGIPLKAVHKIIFYSLEMEKDNFTGEIAYIFYGLIDHDVELHPNPRELEIEGSKFYSSTELKELLKNEKSVDYSKNVWEQLLQTDIISLFKKEEKIPIKKDIALFIGRFQPLHHGHIYVIKKILELCNLLKIGIGSSQLSHTKNDPFASEERKEFINSALKKRGISPEKYKLYEIPDIFNAKKWVDQVISIIGEFNVIFSNSDWVRELFQNKGINVGKKIVIFKNKFNGTNIRNLIIKGNKSWLKLVPKEVVNLIQKFKGVERIKSLYKMKEKSN